MIFEIFVFENWSGRSNANRHVVGEQSCSNRCTYIPKVFIEQRIVFMATSQVVFASGGSSRGEGSRVAEQEGGGREHDETWLVPTPPSLKGSECGEK